MDHQFKITRATQGDGASQRSASIVADADKVLKQFEARHPGSRARFVEEHPDAHTVTVAISIADDVDWSDAQHRFTSDLAGVALVASKAG